MAVPARQTFIVTGASSGIGEATAVRLGQAGANVVLFARRAERLREVARQIDPAEKWVHAVAGDITREADRERLVFETTARFGPIHGLVNNAGFGQRGAIEQVPLDAIRRNFETNVFSLLGLTQKVVPLMRATGGGRIVNIGSVAGRIARPLTGVYDATKHALEAFNDALRGELKPFGIHVALVRPGFILTEFVDAADRISAEVIEQSGPYEPFAQSMRGSSRNLTSIAGGPEQVAKAVEHALLARHPRNHYAVPYHAKAFLLMKWLLPSRVIDWGVRLRK